MRIISSLTFLAQLTLNESTRVKNETATFGKDNNSLPMPNYLLLEKTVSKVKLLPLPSGPHS